MPDTLTDEEIARIAHAALRGSNRPLTTAEIERALQWAHEVRISATLLALVLDGRLIVHVPIDGGELTFGATAQYERSAP